MDWLLILVLFGVAFYQRSHLRALQQRLEGLEGSLDHVRALLREGAAATAPEREAVPDASKPVDEAVRAAPEPAAAQEVSVPKSVKLVGGPKDVPAAAIDDTPVPTEAPVGPTDTVKPGLMERFSFDFEEIFGRNLFVWMGGVTLAVTGVLLVRYSIEAGLLTSSVRVALSFLFGIALLGGAEAAYRNAEKVRDERVCQALAGAGLATLYAGFYLAGTQYGLIGQTFAFLGLAIVTAVAVALSYRFGLPSAILGLVGGFAAPALVGSEEANLPLLALYLALVTGGLTQTGNRQRRPWLGMAALIGGLGWGGLLITGTGFSTTDVVALGLFFVLLGAILPSFLATEKFEQPLRLAAAAIASLQLAVLVDEGGYSPLAWGLYLLLGATLAFFGWQKPSMRPANAVAAAIGILLLGFWRDPATGSLIAVLIALTVMFAGVPLFHAIKGKDQLVDRIMLATVTTGLGLTTALTLDSSSNPLAGMACLALAALPVAGGKVLWSRADSISLALNVASAGLLAGLAANKLLPEWTLPVALGTIGAAIAWILRNRLAEHRAFLATASAFALAAILSLPATTGGLMELDALSETARDPHWPGLLRWLGASLPLVALTYFLRERLPRTIAEFAAALVLFKAALQVLPPIPSVWLAATAALLIRWKQPHREGAILGLLLATIAWAADPLARWLESGGGALLGDPFLLTDLPSVRQTLGFILPFAIVLGTARIAESRLIEQRVPLYWAALLPAFITAHVLFKQVFAVETLLAFERTGLAERILLETLLLGAAWLAAKGIAGLRANSLIASVLAGTALAHFALFTGFWHNPLFARQAVGPVPVANLALAMTVVAIAILLSLRVWLPRFRSTIDAAIMVVATVGAIALLRQVFAGTYLVQTPMSQSEDLLRSFLGILLGIAFLMIGSRRAERSWRIGSLVLMTGTVIKVFGFDAAGLEGLLQVASFLALGTSLIGIGWFYKRQLRAAPQD
ncbi:DUF2339 domain-containing protein [Qipengyuania seohaensis]|uniref:DUF2339 domain-containing protein n=1 Tax=Qipengyuania seohaensis TaxID=266951 RepID=UPI000C222A27|nr:DUF2339 domain-containing protein [Qipengyuania seohaensis]